MPGRFERGRYHHLHIGQAPRPPGGRQPSTSRTTDPSVLIPQLRDTAHRHHAARRDDPDAVAQPLHELFRRWCPPLTELYRDVVLSAGRRREPRRSPFRGGGMSTALRAPGRHPGGAAGVRRAGAVAQLRDRDGRHDRAVAVFGPVGAFVAGQSSRKSLGVAPSAAGVLPAIMAAARTQGLEVPLQPVDDAAGRAAVADGSLDGCSPARRVPSSSSGGTASTPGRKRWSTRPCALRDHHPGRAHPEHAGERSAQRARRGAVVLPFFSQTVMPARHALGAAPL